MLGDQFVANSLWLNGPSWLSEPLYFCHEGKNLFSTIEEAKCKDMVCVALSLDTSLFEFDRWSHFSKAQHIVAWVLRFVHNCKMHVIKCLGTSGPLTSDELDKAKTKMIYCVLREVYPSEVNALLRKKPVLKRVGDFFYLKKKKKKKSNK